MITLSDTLKYYKRKEIQEAIVECAVNREIAIKFGDKGFGKRPDTLNYPSDVLELVKQGATSFHASEELWRNPLLISTELKRQEVLDLRIGWDLVIDIDGDLYEYSRITSYLVVEALKHHGIKNISVKFSGNKGFHIGVPFESFPEKVMGKETKDLFPEAPRRIADYLGEMIKKHLATELLKKESIAEIALKTKKPQSELTSDNKFDPFTIVDIDTILISARHLYRMPYSFNEKSGLISVPIDPDKIREFERDHALPSKIQISKFGFLRKEDILHGEAKQLIVQAFDSLEKEEKIEVEGQREFEEIQDAIPEKFFPPCIKEMLKGVEDGRKRSVFILVNFLTTIGWDYESITKILKEWNNNNKEPLKENILIGQIRYHKQNKKKILPPNCDNIMYYKDIGICLPDNLCGKIRNPVNYSVRKTKFLGTKRKVKRTKTPNPNNSEKKPIAL